MWSDVNDQFNSHVGATGSQCEQQIAHNERQTCVIQKQKAYCPSNTTYLLIPWSRVLLEKLTGSQLLKKFHAFYGTRRFITAFTKAHHLSLSWARSIQSMPHHTAWSSILIVSSHLRLGLPCGHFPSGLLTKTLHSSSSSPNILHAPPISFFSISWPE